MRPIRLPLLVASLLLTAASPKAQTVDYTNAEQMFGEPVTVAVTGKPQRASEAPANVTILTADDIRRSGATDIPAILRFVPGLDVRRYGQLDAAVGIRGYNTAFNPRVLVLVDGRQVYNDDYGYTIWSAIPVTIAEIRQIEIIKGPNAALYGFNAVSGVINIVTFDPLRDRKSSLSVSGGTQREAYGEGVVTLQPSERVGLRFSAKSRTVDEFEGPSFPNSIERPEVRTGSADLRARLTDDVQLDLSASIGTYDANYYVDVGYYFLNQNDANSLRAVLHANTGIGLLQVDLYHNGLDQVATVPGEAFSWTQDTTVLKVSDLVRIGADHTLRLGGEYRDTAIESARYFGGEMTSRLAAGSASWTWQMSPEFAMTNAARIDAIDFERNGDETLLPGLGYPLGDRRYVEASYNSALLYAPTDMDGFRLATGRALQLPSLYSYGFYAPRFGYDLIGSRRLEPSAVTNYEIGYERKLPDISSKLNLSLFYQDTDTLIGSPFGSGAIVVPNGRIYLSARNFAGSEAVGGEVGIDGGTADWRWNLAYSLAQLHDGAQPQGLVIPTSVSYELQTPTHSVVGGLGYSWGALEMDAAARWQSSFVDFALDQQTGILQQLVIPDYVTLNARLGYKLAEGATVSLTAEQANAARQSTAAGRQTERRIFAGLKFEF